MLSETRVFRRYPVWVSSPVPLTGCDGHALSKQRMSNVSRQRRASDRGSALIEVAITTPVLVMMIVAIMRFGAAYNYQIVLTDAARAGARQLAISRGTSGDICNTAGTKIRNAASTLASSRITMRMTVNGSPSTAAAGSLPACNNAGTTMAVNADVSVSLSYPCSFQIPYFSGPSCIINAATTARVE